jgi:predicted deacylase
MLHGNPGGPPTMPRNPAMPSLTLSLVSASPGQHHSLQVHRFGTPGRGPKAMIQAALHADEVPAMLVAQRLRVALAALESQGQMLGEVVLVPYANPYGLAQQVLGQHEGRFDVRNGINFNRLLPDLAAAAAATVQGQLGPDADANVALIRAALRTAANQLTAVHPVEDLKNKLIQLAIDADIVLDLHCDSEAVLHLYALTPHAEIAEQLGRQMGAQAILLATESGDSPFDEACSRPWFTLRQQFAPLPVPLACFSSTVELRGQADTDHTLAQQDAEALIDFLRLRGVIAGAPQQQPDALCKGTPLASSEPVTAPSAGVVVFHQHPGSTVAAGALIADLVCPDTGAVTPLHAVSSGVLYARIATRWATPGMQLAKIAGTTLARTGKLLSA